MSGREGMVDWKAKVGQSPAETGEMSQSSMYENLMVTAGKQDVLGHIFD